MTKVDNITFQEAKPWLIKKHYAHRIPCVQFAFGLFQDGILHGVVTYGTPSSSTLRSGICGDGYTVFELNRLCVDSTIKNASSILVSGSIKLLPSPCILVSYADTNQGHIGYIYQATNWLYTGLSAKRTDWNIEGMEGIHGQTIADKTRGMENRAKAIRQMFGDRFSLVDRPRKHRYIYFRGSKSDRKRMMKDLRYAVLPYPKGESKRYDASAKIDTQPLLF
jgi:hypothetical protein